MSTAKKIGAACLAVVILSMAGIAGATISSIRTKGSGPGRVASMNCPGGMTRLGHTFSQNMSIFEADPTVRIEDEYTVANDFFLVEDIDTGAHAGTHLDAPSHFVGNGRSVDQLAAEEFVWPAYKIDVRGRTFENGLIEWSDIRAFERDNGRIPRGALVILQTGAEEFWGAEVVDVDVNDNSANTDDLFDFDNPGFSADAVQKLFDRRHIDGVGSDAYGPDAASDAGFGATDTALRNDGIALVALANLDRVNVRGDIIVASTVALENGSGFSTDPLACHGRPRR